MASCGSMELRNEPKARNSRRSEEQFDIGPIFVLAGATGGRRDSDVAGTIGQMPVRRDVNGCVARPGSSSTRDFWVVKEPVPNGLRNLRNRSN
jgi:hypothetical protein